MRKAVLAAIALATSNPTFAANDDVISGNYMLGACLDESVGFSAGVCSGRIDGLRTGLQFNDKKFFCRPPKATNKQAIDIYVTYLKVHPELRHLDWALLAIVAQQNAWPCSGQTPIKLLPDGNFAD